MPKRVLAVLHTRAHKIEVEDTANVIFEYGGGKLGYLYASTADEPGYEQLMLCGDKGTLIVQDGQLRMARLRMSVTDHIRLGRGQDVIAKGTGGQQATWRLVRYRDVPARHLEVVRAFARHLLRGTPLVASGADALNELELSNAAYLSGFQHRPVDLPVDAAQMDRLLARLERERSTGRGGGMRTGAQRELRKLLRAR
jgi:predicted dehydrogenase